MAVAKYSKQKFCVGVKGLVSCAGIISWSLDMAANGNEVFNEGFCAIRKLPSWDPSTRIGNFKYEWIMHYQNMYSFSLFDPTYYGVRVGRRNIVFLSFLSF